MNNVSNTIIKRGHNKFTVNRHAVGNPDKILVVIDNITYRELAGVLQSEFTSREELDNALRVVLNTTVPVTF